MSGHKCPAEGCDKQVPRSQLACPQHWRLVSREAQRMVYAAYRARDTEAHLAAMADAIEEMNR